MSDLPFVEVQSKLAEKWQYEFDLAQTDYDRDQIIRAFVLERERMRNCATEAGPRRDEIDRKTLETLQSPIRLGPGFSRDEVIFRRLVDSTSSAAAYLIVAIEQVSQAQSRRASRGRPSRRYGITVVIDELVAVNPNISAKDLGKKLGDDCSITFLDGEYRHNIDASTLKEANLASRLSDSKKRFLKSFSG